MTFSILRKMIIKQSKQLLLQKRKCSKPNFLEDKIQVFFLSPFNMYTQDQKHFVSNGNWFKILIDIPEIHQAYNPFKVTSITTVSPIYKAFLMLPNVKIKYPLLKKITHLYLFFSKQKYLFEKWHNVEMCSYLISNREYDYV